MTRIVKLLSFAFLLSAFFVGQGHAQTINAASCNSVDVQAALNKVAADGTTVVIPAGTCTWSTTVAYNQVYSTTIQGQTTCTGTPASSCIDNTLINLGSGITFNVVTAANKSMRITGMSVNLSNATNYGSLNFSGRSTAFRFDHNDVLNTPNGYDAIVVDSITGVMDHNVYSGQDNSEYIRPLASKWLGNGSNCGSGCGDNSWANATGFGGPNFIYLEDSTMTGTGTNGMSTDCFTGGRFVVRHNTLTDSSIGEHATGHAGDDRGCRAVEFYLNTVTSNPGGATAFNQMFLGAGTAMVWGNTVAANAYSNFATIHDQRCGPPSGSCGQTYNQNAPPTGWGYCGTTYGPSNWDQNTGSTGWACLDQVGRGQGDLLSGLFPDKCNITQNSSCSVFTGQWARQKLEPVYEWNDSWSSCSGCGGKFWAVYEGSQIVANRDYFLGSSGANCPASSSSTCSTGVGTGTLANRPNSCVTNSAAYPAGNSPGVGYWATDQNTLYVCTATNTWTAYYTPYTYPHPLTQNSGSGTPPAAPTGLAAVVQ